MGCTVSSSAPKRAKASVAPAATTLQGRWTEEQRRSDQGSVGRAAATSPSLPREVDAGSRPTFSHIIGSLEEDLLEQQSHSRATGRTTTAASQEARPNLLQLSAASKREFHTRDIVIAFLRFQRRKSGAGDTHQSGPDPADAAQRGVSWQVHNVNPRLTDPRVASLAAHVSGSSNQRRQLLCGPRLSRICRWIDQGAKRDLLDPQDVNGQQLQHSQELMTSNASNSDGDTIPSSSQSRAGPPLSPVATTAELQDPTQCRPTLSDFESRTLVSRDPPREVCEM